MITEQSGIITLTIDPSLVLNRFAHRRVFGPRIFALSVKRFLSLKYQSFNYPKHANAVDVLNFTGSLYEPRSDILRQLELHLSKHDFAVRANSKSVHGRLDSNQHHWSNLLANDLTLITGVPSKDKLFGELSIAHVEWRITEAIACGNLLVVPEISGLDSYFSEGEHYVMYADVVDASDKNFILCEKPGRTRGHCSQWPKTFTPNPKGRGLLDLCRKSLAVLIQSRLLRDGSMVVWILVVTANRNRHIS